MKFCILNEESSIRIDVINFSEWLKQFDKIKFIKIDIEGYEVELLNHLIDSKDFKIYMQSKNRVSLFVRECKTE